MTQQKQNGKLIAIITMIFLFGMISFVTNLAAPMGIVLKNQFSVSNALGMLGNFGNFIAYAVMGIPSGILLQRVGYKKTALIAVAVGFIGVGIQYLSGHSSPDMAFAVYLIGAFIAGFSMCLLNTVVNPMLNKLGGEGNKGNQLIQVGGSFNSVMATITPMFVGILIAGSIEKATISQIFPVMYTAMAVFAIALFFQQFKDYPAVENIFKGIRPAVVALIAAPTFKMAKSAKISRYNVWIPAVSALLIWQLDFSPIYVIILSGLGGYLYGRYKNKTQTDDGGNKA